MVSELDQRVAVPGGGVSTAGSFCKLSTDTNRQTTLSTQPLTTTQTEIWVSVQWLTGPSPLGLFSCIP